MRLRIIAVLSALCCASLAWGASPLIRRGLPPGLASPFPAPAPNTTLTSGLTFDASGNVLINASGASGRSLTNGFSVDSSGNLLVNCAAGCGSGAVSAGTANQLAIYPSSAAAVSGDATFTDNGTAATYTGTGGLVAPKISANGLGSGLTYQTAGADNSAGCPADSDCAEANTTSIATSFTRVGENGGPSVNAIELWAALASGKTQRSWGTLSNPNGTEVQTATGTLVNGDFCVFNSTFDCTDSSQLASNIVYKNAGLTFTGASGAATTIGTSTSNANLIFSPNGTGVLSFPAGAVANPTICTSASLTACWWGKNSSFPWVFSNATNNEIAIGSTNATALQFGGTVPVGWGSTTDATAAPDTAISRFGVHILGVGTGAAGNAAGFITSANKAFVTTDFTDANSASLQAITGLSFALSTTAVNFSFHCMLMYSQATNVAGDQFGVGVITTSPTNLSATGAAFTNTGAASPVSTGVLTGLASTTPTAIVTFQPAVTTVLRAELDGTVETAGTTASTLNFYVLNGTAADVIVVKRGSYCALY
jgi:hypothetical protein